MPAKVLIEALSDTDKITEWNKTLTQAKVLKVLNDECVISYQVEQLKLIQREEQLHIFLNSRYVSNRL